MSTHRNTWKAFERTVARWFGARGRTPLSGGNSMHTRSDTLHDTLFIECKLRQRFSVYETWAQAKKLGKLEDKIPVVCLKQKGTQGFLVLVHCDDLQAVSNVRHLFRKEGSSD